MTGARAIRDIEFDLATALAYQTTYLDRPSDDRYVRKMRENNDLEISALRRELDEARFTHLVVSLEGTEIEDHSISVPYFQRVLASLQSAVRAVQKAALPQGESLARRDSTLRLAGTGPGSFQAFITLPPTQLVLGDDLPGADRALSEILDLFEVMAVGTTDEASVQERIHDWSARAEDGEIRALIRLSSSLAVSGRNGVTGIRLRPADGQEQSVRVTSTQARALTVLLAGESGHEMLDIRGQLHRLQDDPPRVRIANDTDRWDASIDPMEEDLIERVAGLAFQDVVATILVDMRTSATSGAPTTQTRLIEIDAAAPSSGDR